MGCNNSKQDATSPVAGNGSNHRGSIDASLNTGPLTEEEIQRRIVCSDKVIEKEMTCEDGTFGMKIAYLSQKGYYPNGEFEFE